MLVLFLSPCWSGCCTPPGWSLLPWTQHHRWLCWQFLVSSCCWNHSTIWSWFHEALLSPCLRREWGTHLLLFTLTAVGGAAIVLAAIVLLVGQKDVEGQTLLKQNGFGWTLNCCPPFHVDILSEGRCCCSTKCWTDETKIKAKHVEFLAENHVV